MSISSLFFFLLYTTIIQINLCSNRVCFLCIFTWMKITYIRVLVLFPSDTYFTAILAIITSTSVRLQVISHCFLYRNASFPSLHCVNCYRAHLSWEDSWKSLFTTISLLLRIHQWATCGGKYILIVIYCLVKYTLPLESCSLCFRHTRNPLRFVPPSQVGMLSQHEEIYNYHWKSNCLNGDAIYFIAKNIPTLILPCYFMSM